MFTRGGPCASGERFNDRFFRSVFPAVNPGDVLCHVEREHAGTRE